MLTCSLAIAQSKVIATVVANYCLWPAAHYINFKYVPSEHRCDHVSPFCASVSMFTCALLSIYLPCSDSCVSWVQDVSLVGVMQLAC